MASTLVGVRIVGNAVTIFNVGDSRAYLLTGGVNGGPVHILSRDHSLLNDMLTESSQHKLLGGSGIYSCFFLYFYRLFSSYPV